MKIILSITITIFLFSCAHDIINENLKVKLFTYFKENMKEADSSLVLDSVRVIKLDTITKKDIVGLKKRYILDERTKVLDEHDLVSIELESDIKLTKLYNGLDKTLWEHYRNEAKEQMEKSNKLLDQDSLFGKTYDSLNVIFKTSDSTKLLYFEVQCLRQFHRKDMTVKRDTVYAFMNTDKNLIKRDEMTY